jgi:cytochrome b6-f complex iron-sulfur subunit
VIRPSSAFAAPGGLIARVRRRQALRFGFLATAGVAAAALVGALPAFVRVIKIEGLGARIPAGHKADILATFARTNDTPILNMPGRFFLLHAPGAIVAAYRKCTHLGCAVPYVASEQQFHCPCHQSQYDKSTALKVFGPTPRGLDLFHIEEVNGALVVNTNPLEVMVRKNNLWDPAHVEVRDA